MGLPFPTSIVLVELPEDKQLCYLLLFSLHAPSHPMRAMDASMGQRKRSKVRLHADRAAGAG
jgi:hypothetical protein